MTKIITTKWGNSYVREVSFFQEGGTVPKDMTNYSVFYTVKDNLCPNNDQKAKIKNELIINPDQVTNKGKAQLVIDKNDLKFDPGTYTADFKVFDSQNNPVNTEKVTHNHINVVGKDENE